MQATAQRLDFRHVKMLGCVSFLSTGGVRMGVRSRCPLVVSVAGVMGFGSNALLKLMIENHVLRMITSSEHTSLLIVSTLSVMLNISLTNSMTKLDSFA